MFGGIKPTHPCAVWVVATAPTDPLKGSRVGFDDLSPQDHEGAVHREGEKGQTAVAGGLRGGCFGGSNRINLVVCGLFPSPQLTS